MCLGAKVPAAIEVAKKALAEGKCVVIGLQSTGESRSDAYIAQHGFKGQFVSTARAFVEHVINDLLMDGRGGYSSTQGLRMKQPAIPELKNLKTSLKERLDTLVLPDNPLDILIDALGGPDKVAEMTG